MGDILKETSTLIEEAYSRMKQMIFQQKVAPGQKLVYKDLCRMLNMSRTPIINALNRLEQEGFIASEPFRGFHVKPMNIQEAWDLFGVREALETYGVEQAIERGDEKDIEVLQEKLRKHEEYRPNYYDRKRFTLDAEFHLQIATMTRNQALVRLLKMNLEHVYLRYKLEFADPRRMSPAVQEHLELVDKIRKKDIRGAVETIRLHIRRARENIINSLSKEEEAINFYIPPIEGRQNESR